MSEPVRVALLGCGVVGQAVARRLVDRTAEFEARIGAPLQVIGAAVRDIDRPRPDSGLTQDQFTTDTRALAAEADVVVELMGGLEPARELLLHAMSHGASVVTANKVLLGEDGPTLYDAAERAGVDFFYEAAAGAGFPLLRPLQVNLAGDEVHRVVGIVNGTTNFILDKMDRTGADLTDVLHEAQELGYAEADPTADVEGYDARAKAAILASLAFHTRVATRDVHCEGIMSITSQDIAAARKIGCVIKLLAICERVETPQGAAINARVHPALVPRSHPLASVRDAFNAVFVQTALAGELMFYGRGAGGDATASSVLGDLVQAARHRVHGGRGPGESAYAAMSLQSIGAAVTSYSIRLEVLDRPGVLSQVASVFGTEGVSIESMRQGVARSDSGLAALHLVTHRATDAALSRIVDLLRGHDDVATVTSVLRFEGA